MENLNFKTIVPEADIFGLSKFLGVPNVDIEDGDPITSVDWLIEPDVRNDGIDGMVTVIQKVFCVIAWSCYYADCTNEEVEQLKKLGGQHMRNDMIEGTITIDSTKPLTILTVSHSFKVVDDELKFSPGGCICPKNVSIDMQRFLIEIS